MKLLPLKSINITLGLTVGIGLNLVAPVAFGAELEDLVNCHKALAEGTVSNSIVLPNGLALHGGHRRTDDREIILFNERNIYACNLPAKPSEIGDDKDTYYLRVSLEGKPITRLTVSRIRSSKMTYFSVPAGDELFRDDISSMWRLDHKTCSTKLTEETKAQILKDLRARVLTVRESGEAARARDRILNEEDEIEALKICSAIPELSFEVRREIEAFPMFSSFGNEESKFDGSHRQEGLN